MQTWNVKGTVYTFKSKIIKYAKRQGYLTGKSVKKSRYTDLALINALRSTCSKIISPLCRTQVNLTLGIFCTLSCKKRKFELLRRLNFVDSKFSTSGYLMRICYVNA